MRRDRRRGQRTQDQYTALSEHLLLQIRNLLLPSLRKIFRKVGSGLKTQFLDDFFGNLGVFGAQTDGLMEEAERDYCHKSIVTFINAANTKF